MALLRQCRQPQSAIGSRHEIIRTEWPCARHTYEYAKQQGKKAILILLTVRPAQDSECGSFINVLWSELHTQVCNNSNLVLKFGLSRQAIYFQEFMAMIENVSRGDTIDA